jgi:hypothetical protein
MDLSQSFLSSRLKRERGCVFVEVHLHAQDQAQMQSSRVLVTYSGHTQVMADATVGELWIELAHI